ncbi:MAG: hypothetical protein ACI4S1_07530 [Roseburia sp.]
MEEIFKTVKPDTRVLVLQTILVSVMSFSMQNAVAMMALFAVMDVLCAAFLGMKEALFWKVQFIGNETNTTMC